MVSVGTILTLGIVAAVGVAGYAIYSNIGKIRATVSTGITQSISDPFGAWLDSLFQPAAASGVSTAPGLPPGNTPQDVIVQAGGIVPFVPSVQPPFIPPTGPKPPPTPAPTYAPTPGKKPSPGPKPTPGPSYKTGWYYINYEGAKYDTQWYLTAGKAGQIAKTAAAPGDPFLGIKFLGLSKLGPAGFQVFGKSQNYL